MLLYYAICNTAQAQGVHVSDNTDQSPVYQYKDIRSGNKLQLRYDASSNITYNAVTGKNVDFFINTTTGDTISGKGFYIVNNCLKMADRIYGIDRTKVEVRGKKLWNIRLNKELSIDKGFGQFNKNFNKIALQASL